MLFTTHPCKAFHTLEQRGYECKSIYICSCRYVYTGPQTHEKVKYCVLCMPQLSLVYALYLSTDRYLRAPI